MSPLNLQVMVRDPSWVFAYWNPEGELPAAAREALAREPGARWILLFSCHEDGTEEEVEIDREAGNWYVLLRPEAHFESEIGLRLSDGGFAGVARGNPVHMPRAAVSDAVDPEWMVDDRDFFYLFGYPRPLEAASPGRLNPADEPLEWAESRWPLSPLTSSTDVQKKAR